MNELGGRLVEEMARVASEGGGRFLLVTQIPDLHERIHEKGIASLNLSEVMANDSFRISEELKHLNALGNAALAREIAQFLEAEGWIPEPQR